MLSPTLLLALFCHDLTESSLFTFAGGSGGDRFGAALCGPGDLDGDGRADVVVGANRGEGSASASGRAVAYSGATGQVLWEASGAGSFERFGFALGAGRDGDGGSVVAVGAPAAEDARGAVSLLEGVDGALRLRLVGDQAGADFGRAVALIGDVNGDGRADCAVGAPYFDGDKAYSGAVAVFCGASGAQVWRTVGEHGFDQFGFALAAADDLNGDGVGDLWVGAPFEDAQGFNSGAVHLLSGADGARLYCVAGAAVGDQFGFDVSAAGDVDGDGVGDAIAVAPGSDLGGIDSGAARVFGGTDGATVFEVAGEATGEYLSAAVGMGDVDGDGRSEFAVGAAGAGVNESGRVRVLRGADGGLLRVFEGASERDWFGAALGGLGDVSGDGVPDLGVGAPVHDDDTDRAGTASVVSIVALTLRSDVHELSALDGGTAELCLDAGAERALLPYLLLGSAAGTAPGFVLDSVIVDLVPAGGWFLFTATQPNAGPLENTAGLLDASGCARMWLQLAPGSPQVAGAQLHHAGIVAGPLGNVVLGTRSVPLALVP